MQWDSSVRELSRSTFRKRRKIGAKINHAIYCLYAQCQKFNPLLPQMRQTHNKSVGGDSSPFPSGKHLFFSCATHRENRRLGARPGRVRCSASTLFTYQTDTVGQPRLFPSVTHVEEPRAQTRLDLVVTTSLVTQHTRLADFLCYFFFLVII